MLYDNHNFHDPPGAPRNLHDMITPKEGVGRSNRLGDANRIKGLQVLTASPFLSYRSKFMTLQSDYF